MELCKNLTQNTDGKLTIPKDTLQLEETLLEISRPAHKQAIKHAHEIDFLNQNGELTQNETSKNESQSKQSKQATMVRMGFPLHSRVIKNSTQNYGRATEYKMTTKVAPTANSTDLETKSGVSSLSYQCPQCRLYVQKLPIKCPTCNLQLITSPHLARNHHNLFPMEKFNELYVKGETQTKNAKQVPLKGVCSSCNLPNLTISKNLKTGLNYCLDCEIFMREKLHFSV